MAGNNLYCLLNRGIIMHEQLESRTYYNKSSTVDEMGDHTTAKWAKKCGRLLYPVPLSMGGAGSPSNTMWPGTRPTSIPSCILIHPIVWPQYTNVTDRTRQLYLKVMYKLLYMLPVAVARSFSDDSAICYVLPVLWMTSCFHIMRQIQIEAWSL